MSTNTPTGDELKLENKYKSKKIICPECKENARIFIHDYKFSIHGCKNGHHINDMLINNFTKSQYNDIIFNIVIRLMKIIMIIYIYA